MVSDAPANGERGLAPECREWACWSLAYSILLGPLHPNASVCTHGTRFTLDQMESPWPDDLQAQRPVLNGGSGS